MYPAQIAKINPDEFSRCDELEQKIDHGTSLSPRQKTDAAIKDSVRHALWKDDVLRAIEYSEIDVHVKNGVVYLNGHIMSTTSQNRIKNAIRAIPGILAIQNHLVLDDKLTLDASASLGNLEHTYGCKFFTGASHGVVSLNGIVSDAKVKLLAEKCVASIPNVRAVINNVRVSGAELQLPDQPFLQPCIGETIYFLDGLSGVVKQVILNPDNRRVVAMTVWGQFVDYRLGRRSEPQAPERLVVLSMDLVRYMTRESGFLSINSYERKRYKDFDLAAFGSPNVDWAPPYPYCPDDVLFPIEQQEMAYQIVEPISRPSFVVALQEQSDREQLLANDSLGG